MFSRKKVLVVEDNELNRSLLCHILSADYDTLEAENGQEALGQLEQYGEAISIILLDIVMPVMDGYAFLSVVKANPAYSYIPIIVTTQSDGESDEVAALSHGATDFVAKPYKPQVILHRVASIIKLRETAAMINQVQYDHLTGLYSKAFFYQQARELLLRNPEKQYDIICSDVENFKLINDIFGIPAGDRLLCGIAELYEQKINGRGICGRLNSDQFACMMERRWSYTDEMFRTASTQVNKILDTRNIVMKWGIYSIDDRAVPIEQMCDRALLAANSIKGQYGIYFAAYDDVLRAHLLQDQAITDCMETALAENQFKIYLQPKYRITDRSLAGAEALVRWIHPEWGFQPPSKFIPLFEKNGFITKLDQFVWDRTCAVLRKWDDQGLAPISISVNVSRADIYNADISTTLMKIVEKYGLSPSRLHLEITESAYTEDPRQIIDTVSQLRDLGFMIEMDDFGSGYSSLNMLNELPIDILKLDMKFIQSETSKPNSQGILQFIISLARWMHLSVVAEGVETKEQLNRLQEINCDYVQGYYFAKPMPSAEFEDLLRKSSSPVIEVKANEIQQTGDLPVLLVADEDLNYRQEIRRAFDGRYRVFEASNCEDALEYIDNHKEIAVAVLSLTIPNSDGFNVLKIIQQERKLRCLAVIATAGPDAELERKALELGADDFICKPYLMGSLSTRIRHVTNAIANQEKLTLLQQDVYQDFLTGVLNRRGLEAALKTLGEKDFPLVVYLFDLDDLKPFNDRWGHAKGDEALSQFGTLLRAQTRESDILSRIGGDEFVVIMKQSPSAEAAEKKGREICTMAANTNKEGGVSVHCSAGAAVMRQGDSFTEVMLRADQALFQAKNQNKGQCRLWKEDAK